MGHVMRKEGLMSTVLEGMVDGKKGRGRKTYQLFDSIDLGNGYIETRITTQNREEWNPLRLEKRGVPLAQSVQVLSLKS